MTDWFNVVASKLSYCSLVTKFCCTYLKPVYKVHVFCCSYQSPLIMYASTSRKGVRKQRQHTLHQPHCMVEDVLQSSAMFSNPLHEVWNASMLHTVHWKSRMLKIVLTMAFDTLCDLPYHWLLLWSTIIKKKFSFLCDPKPILRLRLYYQR